MRYDRETMAAFFAQFWRRAAPVVTIELDVFAPDGRRSLTLTAPWIRK
jgi:hypothetical protein